MLQPKDREGLRMDKRGCKNGNQRININKILCSLAAQLFPGMPS